MTTRVLVVAKAPVAGRVKTRLGADVGMHTAAHVAAASLLDTLTAAAAAVGAAHCHLSLAGDLDEAVRGEELLAATAGWHVHPQVGDGFAARLARAHADVAATGPGAVVQVGMDTPQLTPALLLDAAAGLEDHDAVLGDATDGGWWVLALRDPSRAACLADVPMSVPETGRLTRAALEADGLTVGSTAVLTDVDTVPDADAVAPLAGPMFAASWAAARPVTTGGTR
ncbi:TIGR04282 family arsenosugar biosynthesis glycosyltransferase [Nocardioides bruguierae]|uniref:TIGR04282 family arsenosugar biosynthesis glycosyltransferase n=1 Tax=Nocardioides bruguierae TaxID=2945102 RepID=UPI0020214C6F|nr:DUF2064 domain-containing protein [Nocardioides bruguierae]MCL8027321.1 DUF2064 domain-containing protein [Nocardioides bruguierae]